MDLWVSTPRATFRLTFTSNVCTGTAPIARWCLGKSSSDVVHYWRGKGATLVWLAQDMEVDDDT